MRLTERAGGVGQVTDESIGFCGSRKKRKAEAAGVKEVVGVVVTAAVILVSVAC